MNPLCLWCGCITTNMNDGTFYCGGSPPPIEHQFRTGNDNADAILLIGDFLASFAFKEFSICDSPEFYRINDWLKSGLSIPIKKVSGPISIDELRKIFTTLNNFQ